MIEVTKTKIRNLKEQLIKAYKKKPSLKEEIIGCGVFLLIGIISFASGRYIDILFDKASSKLILHPSEACFLWDNDDVVGCILAECEGSDEECIRHYQKDDFLKKIRKEGFVLMDKERYIHNKFSYKFFCKRSNKCTKKNGRYEDNYFIREYDAHQNWKTEDLMQNNELVFEHKKEISFANSIFENLNKILSEEICVNYKKVLK